MTITRGKECDRRALAAHAIRQHPVSDRGAWQNVSYSGNISISQEMWGALSANAFNLSRPDYYLSNGKRGGFRRRRRKK